MSAVSTGLADNPWLAFCRPIPESRARFFCFPYAGGGASTYRSWQGLLGSLVEVCPVQLPGRENRIGEPPFTRLDRLVESMDEALLPLLDRPFVLFGYSLGATLAYEWSRYLHTEHGLEPELLIVAARGAPRLPPTWPRSYDLPLDEFKRHLRDLSGTPEDVLENEELMELVLPSLRADFEIHDTYQGSPPPPLRCPVVAFGGRDDGAVPPEALPPWSEVTEGPFEMHILPGDHFGLLQSRRLPDEVTDVLERALEV